MGTDSSLKNQKNETIHFCCGIAFLTESSLIKHQKQEGEHSRTPIDLRNVRMALNTRSSSEFWQTRKRRAAKTFNDEGEEVDAEEGVIESTANVDKDEGDDNITEEQGLANGDESGGEGENDDEKQEEEDDTEFEPAPKKTTSPRRGGRVKKRKTR